MYSLTLVLIFRLAVAGGGLEMEVPFKILAANALIGKKDSLSLILS